ncbi:MAG: hypothetical protein JWO40_22 [Candidatus Doudnabacteria bacterium]|nr:hypothetical protein [Candidatus Doudnabacteria bacterium]
MEIIKSLNLGVAFFLELLMLAVFGYTGFSLTQNTYLRAGFAIAIPLVAVILWAFLAAPNSGTRLHQPWLLLFQAILFGLAFYSLCKLHHPKFALALIFVWIISTALSLFWNQ